MPYLPTVIRNELDSYKIYPENAGDLNYQIHTVIEKYVHDSGESYATYNEIVGALECVKLEVYRRAIAPYEDQKIRDNGDISFYKNLGG